jgi:hypothetical protein
VINLQYGVATMIIGNIEPEAFDDAPATVD